MSHETLWARQWLEEVSEARKALERSEAILDLRRRKAFAIASPAGAAGAGGRGTAGGRLADDVLRMIEAEGEDAALGWARDALAQFDLFAEANRPLLRGQLLNGLDVAEMKYRLGAQDKAIMRLFDIGRSKLYADLNALVDYLDYIGRGGAFLPPAEQDEEPERDMVRETRADRGTGHARIYEDIRSMCAGGQDRTGSD